MSSPAIVSLRGLHKAFGPIKVLDALDLDIREGEFLTLLGPSGCGKTTTLRLIAGFETATAGAISIGGLSMNDVPPHKRRVNTVFQSYALFPHMSVGDNVAFGLRFDGIGRVERRAKAAHMLEIVGLADKIDQRPEALSGGQKQRAALARALIKKPSVLLLDEPLSALDAALRKRLQLELKRIQRETGVTFVYVTHDQEEALTLSDRIVVMQNGQISQCGTPREIYEQPENLFVARFVGQSCSFHVRALERMGHTTWRLGFTDKISMKVSLSNAHDIVPDQRLVLVTRPDDLTLADTNTPASRQMPVRITDVIFAGERRRFIAQMDGTRALEFDLPASMPSVPQADDEVFLALSARPMTVFPDTPSEHVS